MILAPHFLEFISEPKKMETGSLAPLTYFKLTFLSKWLSGLGLLMTILQCKLYNISIFLMVDEGWNLIGIYVQRKRLITRKHTSFNSQLLLVEQSDLDFWVEYGWFWVTYLIND